MTGLDLRCEYETALAGTTWEDLRPLREAGVGGPGLAVGIAVQRISVSRCGLYEPDPDGGPAFIVPARIECPTTPEALEPVDTVRHGDLADLIAISTALPLRWARRTGVATWLGAIEPQYLAVDPTPIWRSPLHWLGNDCHGLALITRSRVERYRLLTHCDAILAEDEDHADELRDLLSRPWMAPPVYVRRGKEVRHAA